MPAETTPTSCGPQTRSGHRATRPCFPLPVSQAVCLPAVGGEATANTR